MDGTNLQLGGGGDSAKENDKVKIEEVQINPYPAGKKEHENVKRNEPRKQYRSTGDNRHNHHTTRTFYNNQTQIVGIFVKLTHNK